LSDVVLRIPEVVVPGKRLGRNLHHDPRSLAYSAPGSTPQTTTWKRVTPVLDQGNLGSCVGNAFTGVLGSDVYFETIPKSIALDEPFAVNLYSLATKLDQFPGEYPPDDSGSSGLGGAKAVRSLNLASGYTHATSLAACYTLIKAGPFAVGFSWHAGMDNPNSEGIVHAIGAVRGGHEFEVLNYDAGRGLWECVNSWGGSWGKSGHFYIPDADFDALLHEQGDATQLTPISQPAPTPTPTPPSPTPPVGFPLAAWDAYNAHHYSRPKEKAMRAAVNAWLAGGGQ
jgi:hypothetical protein